jgi:tetratricopeptide (TPR) repeat protein
MQCVMGLAVVAALAGLPNRCGADPIPGEAAVQPSGPDAQKTQAIQEAAALYRQGDVEGAVKALKAARKKYPDLPPAWIVISQSATNANQRRSALEQAAIDDPEDPQAYQILGEMALQSQMTVEAGLLFEKANAVAKASKEGSPRIAAVRKQSMAGIGAVAMMHKDWKTAQSQLEAYVAEEAKDYRAQIQLAIVLFHLDKPELALERLREAAKINEKVLNPEANLAQLYQGAGDVANAGKWMKAAIEAKPRDVQTRIAAAQWSYDIGKLDQADEQAKAAVQLDPESFEANTIRGMVALARKDYETADQCLRKAHLLGPGVARVTSSLALALAESTDENKKRLALEFAQLSSRQTPDSPEGIGTVGWVQYKLGNLADAEANLSRAVNASQNRPIPDVLYYYARLLADRGRTKEAKELLEHPVMKAPGTYMRKADAEALLEQLNKGTAPPAKP